MICIIIALWSISVACILIFFYGATSKEKEMEYRDRVLEQKKDRV